jgi:hypothetical protein
MKRPTTSSCASLCRRSTTRQVPPGSGQTVRGPAPAGGHDSRPSLPWRSLDTWPDRGSVFRVGTWQSHKLIVMRRLKRSTTRQLLPVSGRNISRFHQSTVMCQFRQSITQQFPPGSGPNVSPSHQSMIICRCRRSTTRQLTHLLLLTCLLFLTYLLLLTYLLILTDLLFLIYLLTLTDLPLLSYLLVLLNVYFYLSSHRCISKLTDWFLK